MLQIVAGALLIFSILTAGQVSPPEGLREAVESFWAHLKEEDLASAISYIYADDLNNYLTRKRLRVVAATWTGWQRLGESTYTVSLETRQEFQGRPFPISESQTWEETEGGWKLRVPESSLPRSFMQLAQRGDSEWPKEVRLFPARITFHKDANLNRAGLTIQNGLDQAAEVVAIELDAERFKVLQAPDEVAAGTRERILLEFVGEETDHNLTAQGRLHIRVAGVDKLFDVPIVYNFHSPVRDWVRRKSSGQKQEAPPGVPRLPVPAKPPQNPKPPL